MSQYFPKLYEPFGGDLNVKVDLSNYATKTDLKIYHMLMSNLTSLTNLTNLTNLASLKTEVDKLDIDKLAPVPADLRKLSDVVKNDVVKKIEYDNLVTEVDNTDTTKLVLKTTYDTDNSKIEETMKLVGNEIDAKNSH